VDARRRPDRSARSAAPSPAALLPGRNWKNCRAAVCAEVVRHQKLLRPHRLPVRVRPVDETRCRRRRSSAGGGSLLSRRYAIGSPGALTPIQARARSTQSLTSAAGQARRGLPDRRRGATAADADAVSMAARCSRGDGESLPSQGMGIVADQKFDDQVMASQKARRSDGFAYGDHIAVAGFPKPISSGRVR